MMNNEMVLHNLIDKILDFKELKDGWHFGEGNAPSNQVSLNAINAAKIAIKLGFKTDAIPEVCGSIMIWAIRGDLEIELIISDADRNALYIENENERIEEYEDLTFDVALDLLKQKTNEIWSSGYGSFTRDIILKNIKNLQVVPSQIAAKGGSPSYKKNVSCGSTQYAIISVNSTKRALGNHQFISSSTKAYSLQGAKLKVIQPRMNATTTCMV